MSTTIHLAVREQHNVTTRSLPASEFLGSSLLACTLLLLAGSARSVFAQSLPPASEAPVPPAEGVTPSDPELQRLVAEELEILIRKHHLPAMTMRVVIDGRIAASATRGLRALGRPETAEEGDLWHIGSCTKLFTSTMIARLVDRGVLSFDQKLEDSLPADLVALLHAEMKVATLAQLLAHTAGIDDQEIRDVELLAAVTRFQEVESQEIRESFQAASVALSHEPWRTPGTAFKYSNYGFIVAAAIASHATQQSWRELVREQVCVPLQIEHYGFGAPGTNAAIDQPRGHQDTGSELRPIEPADPDSDNPPHIDPAGRIHISFDAWQRFLEMVIAGFEKRSDFLTESTFARLLTPLEVEGSSVYALGIGVIKEPDGSIRTLTHSGCNTLFRADFRYFVKSKRLQMMATNCGNEASDEAFRRMQETLSNEFEIREGRAKK